MLSFLNDRDGNIVPNTMPCFNPLTATRYFDEAQQKYVISFNNRDLGRGQTLYLPCGQCIGCRIARSREWAARCVHEATCHEKNCFITLTYDPDHLPEDGSVHVEDFQKFMKRLRRRFPGTKFRYLHCGEYGSQLGRPHYHAIIFGFDFPDKTPWRVSHGDIIWRSPILEELWPYGFSTIGAVSFESCAYVARYVTKKITGDAAEEHYKGKKPEYITMSRRPGIGAEWFDKYHSDVFPQDFVVLKNGKKIRTPRYYMNLLGQWFPDVYDAVQVQRLLKAQEKPSWSNGTFLSDLDKLYDDYHEWRRRGEVIQHRVKKRLPRNFENAQVQ